MILCDSLEFEGAEHKMAGVFPVGTTFCPRPQGLGYTEAVAEQDSVSTQEGQPSMGMNFIIPSALTATANLLISQ